MQYTRLGRTGLEVSRSSFGALPIQRLTVSEAGDLLRKAFDGGINFFDTARAYSDSEEKMGLALGGIREKIVIATKTAASTAEQFRKDLEKSLAMLRTDRVDIYQFHNPERVPLAGSDLYDCMSEAREQGKIRFIGITNHRIDNAVEAAESGLYDTIQFPLSALSTEQELAMAADCGRRDIGVIAMKALCGGLLTSAALTMSRLRPMSHVVPIWGFQKTEELDEVLALEKTSCVLDEAMQKRIDNARADLGGDFCRGCGYCQPCVGRIEIQMCARMPLLLKRGVWQDFVTPEWREKMERIEDCVRCGQCLTRCPYKLNTPELLRAALEDYRRFLTEKGVS